MSPLRPTDVELEPLADMAKQYVELVSDGEPNGWGQYVHEKYGLSHHMLYLMQVRFGAGEVSDAVDKAFKKRRDTDP